MTDNKSSFQIPGRIWEYCLARKKYNDDGGVSKVTDNHIFQIPGRIWEYCLAKEKYNDDGGVSKVTDNKYISDSWSYLGVLFSQGEV